MSGTRPADELYFPLSASLFDESDWLSSTKPKPSLRGFYWALLLSILIHLLLVQWQPPVYQPQTKSILSKPIHLTLNYATPSISELAPFDERDIAEPLPEQPAAIDITVPDAVIAETKIKPKLEIKPELKIVPQVLDKEVLQTTIEQQNRYRDAYLPAPESNKEFSIDVPSEDIGREQTPNQFSNVFDPRLRARLQNNPARRASQQVSGPSSFTNIHGNTLVKLNNGLCMSSTPAAPGQPTNWYITACGGIKSESEQMMERVNRDFQNRR